MTLQEFRENFIESQFSQEELELLKEQGLYQDYVEGWISINTIYAQMKDQGV
jgi:hypothetical protein